MSDEFLGDRKKALEEQFFAKENAKLVARLRAQREKEASKEGLRHVSGISDEALFDKLAGLGLDAETWAALSLVPLVEVAWADGRVQEKERRAVLSGAEANGVTKGSPSYKLLENWLAQRPEAHLIEAWGEYMVDLCAQLGESERQSLKDEVLGRARGVAEAAGGILGLANKVSREEEIVLARLEKAFEA